MRLAVLKKDINVNLPKGIVLFWLDDSYTGNEYDVDVAFELEKNTFKSSEELHDSLIFVFENPFYKRTSSQLSKRNSKIIEKLQEHGLIIDWQDTQDGKVNFQIIENNGFKQKFIMRKKKNIFYTIHLFFDIVDAKIEYLDGLKIR